MFPKEVLVGVFISKAVYEINIIRDDSYKIGYAVLCSIAIRADEKFLKDIHRTLGQYNIKSKLSLIENPSRPKPILRVSGIQNCRKVMELIPPHFSDANNSIENYRIVIAKLVNKEHLTLEGFDSIVTIRGI
jgi:hypothetical protein|tara:strand:- start:7575 stop:7970 length:396 start_codon:yes stop_codon:yes gene_type:complete